jgi:hypothetical protein
VRPMVSVSSFGDDRGQWRDAYPCVASCAGASRDESQPASLIPQPVPPDGPSAASATSADQPPAQLHPAPKPHSHPLRAPHPIRHPIPPVTSDPEPPSSSVAAAQTCHQLPPKWDRPPSSRRHAMTGREGGRAHFGHQLPCLSGRAAAARSAVERGLERPIVARG